jgi:hypothetical protein
MKNYTLKELEELETISQGQADDLKIEDGNIRVWLSRMTIEDGMPYNNQVSIEKLQNGAWKVIDEYEAK